MIRSYLGKRGYVLIKQHWASNVLEECRKDCIVQPFSPIQYGEIASKFPIYRECQTKLYLPKFYGLQKFGPTEQITIPDGDIIDISFQGQLREHQIEPVRIVMDGLLTKGGGILSVGCGWGKTIAACYILTQLKRKTFILVHKEFLMNQWKERIQSCIPTARIGKVQGSVIDIDNKDIVIGMVQSISMKEYPIHLFDSFGFLVLDEAHRVPSREFSKSFTKIQCPYMLALSATPERSDGLTKVLKWFIGDILYEKKSIITVPATVRRIFFRSTDVQYKKEVWNHYFGQINRACMLNQIAEFVPRIHFIVSILCPLVQEEQRQILVLSDRKELLYEIEIQLQQKNITCGYYIGGMKPDELIHSTKQSIILATYPMAAEGLDISTIDTILLATPKTNVEQAIGRIRIQTERINDPLILDIIDDFSIFSSQAYQRLKLYKKKGYQIENEDKISSLFHETDL